MQNDYLKSQFLLKEGVTYLNNGAFGACPKPIFERYQQYQLELEQEPTRFITENGLQYLKQSREALANFIHCDADNLVYVTNPSYAVTIVAKSFNLKAGDEVLSTNLEYGPCDKTWAYYCAQKGAKYVQQKIRFPLHSKEDFIEQFFQGLTGKTKLIFISHITSNTGLRLPVDEVCAVAKQKGILTFVDGAHAPGQLSIDLSTLQPDFYTGACHKWMLAPKGCSFFYAKKELQPMCEPLIISWGDKSDMPQFTERHQLQGTRDFSAFLTIPAAIDFMAKNNWPTVAENCRTIARSNAERFCELLKATPLTYSKDDFLMQMCCTPIKTKQSEQLHDLLLAKYKIQVPVMPREDMILLRYSIQAFNSQKDLDVLYVALEDIIRTTNLIEV